MAASEGGGGRGGVVHADPGQIQVAAVGQVAAERVGRRQNSV
jgi:hypothetical protein